MRVQIVGPGTPGIFVFDNFEDQIGVVQQETSDVLFDVGKCVWGLPNTPLRITRANLHAQLGPLVSGADLVESLEAFFRSGGTRAIACRIVGGAAAVKTLTIQDRAVAPLDTIRIDSKYPTATVDILVTISAGTLANTVKITEESKALGVPRTSYDNFKLTFTAQEQAEIAAGTSRFTTVQQINQLSALITITDLESATVAPNNLPALTPETPLAGGNDGFTGVTDATYIGTSVDGVKTGLQVFNDMNLGRGQVILYGVTTADSRDALITHGRDYARTPIFDLPMGLSHNDVIDIRDTLDTSFAGLYFPNDVEVTDYAGSGLKKLMYPSPFLAGVYALAESDDGIGRAPAGFSIPGIHRVGVTVPGGVTVDAALQATLASNQINAIRLLPQRGWVVYDEWVLKSAGALRFIHQRRVINHIIHDLGRMFSGQEFRINDGGRRLMNEVRSKTRDYLEGLGDKVLTAYSVQCDNLNNTPTTLAQQKLICDVGVQPVDSARMIIFRLNRMPTGTQVEFSEAA